MEAIIPSSHHALDIQKLSSGTKHVSVFNQSRTRGAEKSGILFQEISVLLKKKNSMKLSFLVFLGRGQRLLSKVAAFASPMIVSLVKRFPTKPIKNIGESK